MTKQHLLLVDDDAQNLRIMEVGLRKAGFSVATAASGTEALEQMGRAPPELVLCEARLPGLDGFQLLERVRSDERTRDVPFLLLTSRRSLGEKVRGLEMGADDYITKPIYIKELVTRIRVLIERREKELLERRDQRGTLTGSLSDLGLVDLLQTLDAGRKTGVIRCNQGRRDGAVWVWQGRVVDAEVGRLQGEVALYRLLTWSEGAFEVEFSDFTREPRIEAATQALLMEGMRRLDEWGRMLEQLPPLGTVLEVEFGALAQRLADIPDEVNGMLRLFDGKRALEQVIDEARFDELQSLAIVTRLFFEGIVREARPEPSRPAAGGPSLEAWINPSGVARAGEDEGLAALAAPVAAETIPSRKGRGKKKSEEEAAPPLEIQGAPLPHPGAIISRDYDMAGDVAGAPTVALGAGPEAASAGAEGAGVGATSAPGPLLQGEPRLALDLAALIGGPGLPAPAPVPVPAAASGGLPQIYVFPPRRGIRKARLRREAEAPAAPPQAVEAALLGTPIPLTQVVAAPAVEPEAPTSPGAGAGPPPIALTAVRGAQERPAPAGDGASSFVAVAAPPAPLGPLAFQGPASVAVRPAPPAERGVEHAEHGHDEEMAEMLRSLRPGHGRWLAIGGAAVLGIGAIAFFAFSGGSKVESPPAVREPRPAPAALSPVAPAAPAPAASSPAPTPPAPAPAAPAAAPAAPAPPPPSAAPAAPALAPAPAAPPPAPAPAASTPASSSSAPPSDDVYRRALATGQARYEKGDLTGAIREFRKAVDAKPDSVPALQALGNAQFENDDLRSALKLLQRAAELDAQNARTELLLGTVLQTLGKDREAKGHYQKYLKLAPNGEFAADVRAVLKDLK